MKSETLEARLQSLTLGCRRAAAKVDDPLLFPAAQAVYRGLALGLAKTAFDTAIREGTDVTPAFGPRSPEDRPWKHNRPRTAIESLRECYAVVQALQDGLQVPQDRDLLWSPRRPKAAPTGNATLTATSLCDSLPT